MHLSMRRLFTLALLLSVPTLSPAVFAAEAPPTDLLSLNAVPFQVGQFTDKDNNKVPAGTVEKIDGKFGPGVHFTFAAGANGGFMLARLHPSPEWDKADGFSFWVKGDGSDSWGGIELIDKDNFGLRYGYCFPIDSTEWRKITVPWRDLTPELAGPLVNPPKDMQAKESYAPSGLGNFWFGKWFYWRDYPACSFSVDKIALEPKIDPEAGAVPLTAPEPAEPGLKRLRAKLQAHKPVTIVTMGDSLSDEHHWSNKQVVWSRLLTKALHDKYGSEAKLVNPAIGGTTLSQNIVLMPRWGKAAPSPDLVVVWFGGNDWDNNVRGQRFAECLRLAVDRIRRQTHGSADVLLLTTGPAHDRWETQGELEQAVRDVAKERKTGLADVAADFRKAGSPDEAMKQQYWAWDKVHLGAKGHEVARDAVLRAIEEAK